MDDLVHGKWRRRGVGVGLVVSVELFRDPFQPTLQQRGLSLLLARIERREGSHDPGLALGDHQIRV
eukprot:CAMPEP_0195321322 /NCGR_PEP_ID=MMETSP0708-20121125/6642_1 /TAXON_ID=33640 /ORGANISM="Asterionellopsis glacialis, Strain CCMP134" /LENGTH=65 /DNA_ID=CAMNT_0040387925 /DNA_START=81 /DNA_END=278 /DNA_ORIENTATION=+